MNSEREIRNLRRRVAAFECSFAGPALRISALHKDLLAFQARTEERFERVLGRFDRIDRKFDRIGHELRGLRADIPKIVRRAVRNALRDQGAERR